MNPQTMLEQLCARPLTSWQLDATTVTLLAMLVGRGYRAIRAGGGLRGLWHGLIYGGQPPPDKPNTSL